MKTILNLTIEKSLLESVKSFADRKNKSVSELVEDYFRTLSKPANKKNVISLADQLPKPKFDVNSNLKKQYYEGQSGRHTNSYRL